jgi:hypothetical protein
MEAPKLSALYHLACARSQEILVDLYEDLHDSKGLPVHDDADWVKSRIQKAVKEIRTELSLINSAIEEL